MSDLHEIWPRAFWVNWENGIESRLLSWSFWPRLCRNCIFPIATEFSANCQFWRSIFNVFFLSLFTIFDPPEAIKATHFHNEAWKCTYTLFILFGGLMPLKISFLLKCCKKYFLLHFWDYPPINKVPQIQPFYPLLSLLIYV